MGDIDTSWPMTDVVDDNHGTANGMSAGAEETLNAPSGKTKEYSDAGNGGRSGWTQGSGR